jgi:hypothetical protein
MYQIGTRYVVSTPITPESDRPIARRPISSAESASAAVVRAFETVDGRPAGERVLYDFVDPDALDTLLATGGGDATVRVRLWDHPVVVTPERVTVYAR